VALQRSPSPASFIVSEKALGLGSGAEFACVLSLRVCGRWVLTQPVVSLGLRMCGAPGVAGPGGAWCRARMAMSSQIRITHHVEVSFRVQQACPDQLYTPCP
jgi:hypothetical protein